MNVFPRQLNVLDDRSLAAFRILLGLHLLQDTYTRFALGRYDLLWYTEDGFLAPSELPHRAALHRIWFYRGSESFQAGCVAASVLLALASALGVWDGPTPKVLLLLTRTAEQNRNMPAHDGSDAFVRHLLLWSCYLPLTRVWSWAAWRRRSRGVAPPPSHAVRGLPCLALPLQVVLMYVGTALLRWEAMGWASEWLPPRLTAVHYALNGSFAARDNALTRLVRRTPPLSRAMTASAMVIEGIVPVLCLLGGPRLRSWLALQLVLLHLGLLLMVNLVNWQSVGMLVQVLWVPGRLWDRWLGTKTANADVAVAAHKKTDGDQPPVPIDATPEPLRSGRLSRALQVFFFSYMVYNWMGNRNWGVGKLDHGDIGEGLRLSQWWVMYKTVGMTARNAFLTGYAHVSGGTDSGGGSSSPAVVDLLHYVKTGDWKLQAPLGMLYQDMTDHYPSARWERALTQWIMDRSKRPAIQTFCAKLCELVNDDRRRQRLPPLTEIELSWLEIGLMPLGSPTRYDRDRITKHSVSVECVFKRQPLIDGEEHQ